MKTALTALALLLASAYICSRPMPRCRYSRGQDFPFRLDRDRLHLRNSGNGASVKVITARDGKRGGRNAGGRSIERANAAIGWSIRGSGIGAFTTSLIGEGEFGMACSL